MTSAAKRETGAAGRPRARPGELSLPASIESTLRRLIWRSRAAITARGVLATLAAAALAVLVATLIAATWPIFEAWQHYALTLLWVAAGGATAVLLLVRPLARSFTLAGIARVIEQRHPELHERISSTVELLSSEDAPEIRGSEALIRALAVEAGEDARTVQPRREITFRGARPFLIVFAAAVAAIAALCAFSGGMRKEFAKRLLPFLNLPNLYAEDLRISPGRDRVLAEGERLEVKVAVARVKVRSAEFRLRRDDAGDNIIEMSRLADGSFAYTTPPLKQSLWYRVRAGDAVSRYYNVTVVPRPAVAGVEVAYDYPDYLGLGDAPPRACDGQIRGPVGSVATVRVRLNKPVVKAELLVNNTPAELTRADSQSCGFVHDMAKPGAGTWRLVLTDGHGYTGEATHEIIVTPDAGPTARILMPVQDSLKLKPTDRLPIFYRLRDDHGLSRAELAVSVDGRERPALPLPAVTAPQTRPAGQLAASEALLKLAELDLASARQVTFQVRAWDNLPAPLGGPQEGISATKTIELDVKADSYVFQVQLALDLRVRETLERIYQQLKAAKTISEPLRRSMPNTRKLTDNTIAKLDTLRQHLLTAEGDTRALAEETAGSTYPKLSEKLLSLADRHVGPARQAAELIKITDDQAERAKLANDEVDYHIDRALAIVSELLKQFDVLTDLARRAIQLAELAERQQALAAAKMDPTTQPTTAPGAEAPAAMTDEQWQKLQNQLARDTAQEVRRTPNALHEALDRGGQATRNLAEMAQTLQRQQQALLQHTASAERIRQMTDQLAQLAREQADVARQAGQLAARARTVEPTTQPAGLAARQAQTAAQALTTTQPASAIPAQAAAAAAMDETAGQAQAELQRHAAAQLAEAAERMAEQQAELARRSETAQQHAQAAQAAQQLAAQHAARQQQVLGQVGGRLAALAGRQAAAARQAQQLEGAVSPPAGARPAGPTSQAAEGLRRADPAAAAEQARQAAGQAGGLETELTRRAGAAEQAAQQAAGRSQQAAEGAKQAQAAAQQAAQASAQAQGQARKSGTPQDQQAAQAAQAGAQQAAERASAAQKAAQAAEQLAQQARQAQQQTAGQAAQAKGLASEQAQLAKDIAAAAGREAPQLAQAVGAAQQAAAARTQAASRTQQAAQAIQGAAGAQQQLAKQVPQLAKLAEQATPAARQAFQRHDPTGNMRQAAGELAHSRAAQAAPAQRSAEQQLRRIAQAAREQVPRTDAQRAAERLAAAAEQMAGEQDRLARQSAAAGPQPPAQQAQAAAQAQQQLAQRLPQLRQLAQQATPAAQAAMRAHDPSANMQRAAGQLQAGQPRQAAQAQQAAAGQLRQLAQAARRENAPSPPAQAGPLAQAARDLAARQRGLQQRTAELTRQLAQARAQLDQQELTRLQAEQQQIAREAGDLADDVREQAPQPDRVGVHAAQAAAEAARQMAGRRLAAAAETGRRAAGMMNQMSRRLGRPGQHEPGQGGEESAGTGHEPGQGGQGRPGQGSPGQPGPSGQQVQAATPSGAQEPDQVAAEQGPTELERRAALAGRAGDLARRQQRVAEEAAALAGRQGPQLMASRQGRIAEGTADVQRGAELIDNHIGDLMPDATARQLSQAATGALRQAAAAQAAAAQAMSAGRPGQSVPSQQGSAGALGRAAQSLRQLGRHFSEQARRAQQPPPAGQDSLPGELAEAYGATRSAAQSQAEADAAAAARMLAALAAQAGRQAMAMGVVPMPGMATRSPQGFMMDSDARVGAALPDLTAAQLEKIGITLADWARLPGELRDQVLQSADLGGPPEYRALIKRYFQAIAKVAAETEPPTEKPKK